MADTPEEPTLLRVLEVLARERRLDLRDYRRSTLARRTAERMESLGISDPARYDALLASDGAELRRLADFLLVHATSFFRDPSVFETLAGTVVPALAAEPLRRLRAWVIGASTGEEAYSLATLLEEARSGAAIDWEILATDRDERSLATARAGRYPLDALGAVPERYRSAFLVRDGVATVVESLRERLSFEEHDFMGPRLAPAAAILAEFDLVLCRNVLIYLDDRFQKGAAERLAAVVRPGGCLVLGLAETVPEGFADRFEVFPGTAPELRIFRRTARAAGGR